MKLYAAQRLVVRSAATAAICVAIAGCAADPANAGGDQPGVIVPNKADRSADANNKANANKAAAGRSDASGGTIASVEGVAVPAAQLNALLYASNGLEALLKLVQLNMAKAEVARRSLTVTPADIAAERKITMELAFPGQDAADYDELLKQLLTQQRVSRAEFDVVMETNANLRACVRGQASSDITEPLIQNEFNLLYGERVRVRDIPVNNLQEVAEVKRMLALPGARFEDVARRMGKIPALANLGGQLPEFARTTTGYSRVFVDAAFALKPGEVSTDPIQEEGYFHILKLEDRIAPKAVKLDDVRDSVRAQLIARRSSNLMAAMRQDFAQRAIREMEINEPTMKAQFDERVAAASPKPADKREVQQSLEAQSPTTAPAAHANPAAHAAPAAATTRAAAAPAPADAPASTAAHTPAAPSPATAPVAAPTTAAAR